MAKATVIIPNYDGLHFLKPCLEALDKQSFKDFDIIVVDNGSKDGSVEYLKNERSDIGVIGLNENTGFCHAVNEGVKAAVSDYVILLNNDTVPDTDFVGALVKSIGAKADAFSVGSCMIDAKDNTVLDGAGDLYNALGWAFARGKGEKISKYNVPCKIFSACAGAAIYNRMDFVKLGLLDETHFAYLEDMDIGWRARLLGRENYYEPKAKVVHLGSGTTGGRHNSFKVKSSARNNIYMIRKNMRPWQKVINAPFIFLGTLVKFLYFTKKGLGKDYLDGFKSGMKLPKNPEINIPENTRFSTVFKLQLRLFKNIFGKRS